MLLKLLFIAHKYYDRNLTQNTRENVCGLTICKNQTFYVFLSSSLVPVHVSVTVWLRLYCNVPGYSALPSSLLHAQHYIIHISFQK